MQSLINALGQFSGNAIHGHQVFDTGVFHTPHATKTLK
jgi:hypothetical protein